jgi:hypothetical protein
MSFTAHPYEQAIPTESQTRSREDYCAVSQSDLLENAKAATAHLPPRTLTLSTSATRRHLRLRLLKAIGLLLISYGIVAGCYTALVGPGGMGYAAYFHGSLLDDRCDIDTESGIQSAVSINIWVARGLRFYSAKLIDITWNLVVGQGGRALFGWISYVVFTDAITRSLEALPGSFELYNSINFNTTSSVSLWIYAKSIFKLRGVRRTLLLGWILFSTIVVLLWPTITASCAGFVPNSSLASSQHITYLHAL